MLAPARICYAMKANGNLAVLRLLAGLGAGADVVSEGEMRRALAAGIAPERIVFSGVGKTETEMEAALLNGVLQINVESASEFRSLARIADRLGQTASVALRINPDVDAGTLDQISTGRKTDKFGVAWTEAPALFDEAARLPGLSDGRHRSSYRLATGRPGAVPPRISPRRRARPDPAGRWRSHPPPRSRRRVRHPLSR